MPNRQSLRAHNIQLVTKAALELFYKNGIDATTINDIAKLAGVSKMSVFRYFDTKADIVKAATQELFINVNYKFKRSQFSAETDKLTGMELIKNYLDVYLHLIDHYPNFLNYLCAVEIFYSKHEVSYLSENKNNFMYEFWVKAIERGMADQTIAVIDNYKSFHSTIYNLFKGINVSMYITNKDLSSTDTKKELRAQSEDIIKMTIKYLTPYNVCVKE